MFGTLFTPAEALSIGLVDELAPDVKAAEQRCLDILSQLNANVPEAVHASKAYLRKDLVDRFLAGRKEDLEYHVKIFSDPEMKKKLHMYLESVRKRQRWFSSGLRGMVFFNTTGCYTILIMQ